MTSRWSGVNWDVSALVAELREIRTDYLEVRGLLHQPPKLPAKKALQAVLEQLAAALFPHRLGRPDLSEGGVDYFVGHTLESALHELYRQVLLELQFSLRGAEHVGNAPGHAEAIVKSFAAELPRIRRLLDSDVQAAYEGDPAARSADEVLVCYPGVLAVMHYRIAHPLYRAGAPMVARMISELAHSATGIDIHPGAQIADSFFVDHGTGVVIGETAVIGRRVRLYQAVTLGAKRFAKDENGSLVKGNARHPIVEDDVVIYAGATILGRITIGAGSTIGGNVWLTHSVSPGSLVSQALARSDLFESGGGI